MIAASLKNSLYEINLVKTMHADAAKIKAFNVKNLTGCLLVTAA
jgi:hypothetical protein